ncbi:MAG: lipopolysaccharide heptosyltransferase II [Anaerohalosphaeraceae bacterium]
MKRSKNTVSENVKNIVVRCPNWVGDIVMATPFLDCLSANFPNASMTAVVRRYARGIIEDGPWFDQIIDADDKSLGGLYQVVRNIRQTKPDLAFLLPNSFRSALTLWLGGAKTIYGYRRDGRAFFLDGGPRAKRKDKHILPIPMTDYYLEICRSLKLSIPDSLKPRLFIGDQLNNQGQSLLKKYGIENSDKVIGLNPGASFGSSKCWSPKSFARLAELLQAAFKAKIILFVGPGEDEIAQTIMETSRADIIDTAPDRVDLALLKPLIKRCDVLITNDTGPRHYAVAFDVPVVAIMGPTDPRYTAANLEKTVVIRRELECSPCHKKICPIDHRCMNDITPESVIAATQTLLHEDVSV